MTLRIKLLLAQAPLAAALVLVGFVAVSNVASLGRYSEVILKENYRSVLSAQRMKEAIERIQDIAVLPVNDTPGDARGASIHQQFEFELREAEANITEVGEAEVLSELRKRWEVYQGLFHAFTTGSARTEKVNFLLNDLEPAFAATRQQAQILLDMNQDAMVRTSDRAQREATRIGRLMIAAPVAGLILGVLLSTMVTSRLLQPFELLARTVSRLSEGDFETRIDVPGGDEVAKLANDVNAMATRLGDYRRSSLGELLLAQEASQAAIDSLPDPVVVFDLNGSILNLNRASETLLGLGLDAEGKPLSRIDPQAREVVERIRSHVLTGKGAYVPRGFDEAVRVNAPDGEHYLLPRAVPVHSEEGAVTGAAVILQDVTRLRRVDDLRNNLVSTVAHEFRTPLTSLRMAIHLCLEQAGGPLTAKQGDLLYAAREECERLQAMVDELLDLARIQSGRIDLHRVSSVAAALVDAALDAHRSLAEERSLIFEREIEPGLPEVDADRERIQLVFSNLITNAIRYTPAGGQITVRAKTSSDGRVRFEIADTGAGIPSNYETIIFEKFVRGPETPGGAGLGLSIAKDVVEAHGGEIGVQGTPGGGATFWFTLPVAGLEEVELAAQPCVGDGT